MSIDFDWTQDVIKTGGQPGAHWLGNVERSALPARLHLQAVEDAKATAEKGRPVFTEKLFITVYLPGGDTVIRAVKESDKYEWPAAFQAWERDKSTPQDGTPLEEWPQIGPGAIATLKANNVFTVEGLLALSDTHCDKIGPVAGMFRQKAEAYVKRAEGQNLELEAVKTQNADMAEQLKVMQEQIAKLSKPRGRPVGSKNKVKVNVTPNDHPGRDEPVGTADA